MKSYLIVGVQLLLTVILLYLGNLGWGNKDFMAGTISIFIVGTIISMFKYGVWPFFLSIILLGGMIWGIFFYR